MNIGYQTSKNRVSMGLALSEERAFKLRRMASDASISVAETVGRLVDREWDRVKGDQPKENVDAEEATEGVAA